MIGRSGFTIPYLDGSLSISRASRAFPQYLIFKPSMILKSILLYYYWRANNVLINKLYSTSINYKFKIFGIMSAIFLTMRDVITTGYKDTSKSLEIIFITSLLVKRY